MLKDCTLNWNKAVSKIELCPSNVFKTCDVRSKIGTLRACSTRIFTDGLDRIYVRVPDDFSSATSLIVQPCRAQRPKSVSLIGCIHCQQVCPDNKKFLQWIEGDEGFSHEETTLFLAGASVDQLPAATVKKTGTAGVAGLSTHFPCNLGVFFRTGH